VHTFTCGRCGHLLDFVASACGRCGAPQGFALPESTILVLDGPGGDGWARCAEHGVTGCNWLVRANDGPRCESCRLTRTVPGDDDPDDAAFLVEMEAAKRRLVFQLHDIGLPVVDRGADPEAGLAFDLLSTRYEPVTIGHADGVITIDLAESDDAHRELLRNQLDEPYRTVLGHLRHEVGHYYWDVLIDRTGRHDDFRALFGDERASYQEALDRHYSSGAPDGWHDRFVSAYATMHPWEDWAETFAHYLHIRDTLQTAAAFGMVVEGPRAEVGAPPDLDVAVVPTDEIDGQSFWAVARDWTTFSAALNAVNRSMGHAEAYPFDLTPPAIAKLSFLHEIVRGASSSLPSADPAPPPQRDVGGRPQRG